MAWIRACGGSSNTQPKNIIIVENNKATINFSNGINWNQEITARFANPTNDTSLFLDTTRNFRSVSDLFKVKRGMVFVFNNTNSFSSYNQYVYNDGGNTVTSSYSDNSKLVINSDDGNVYRYSIVGTSNFAIEHSGSAYVEINITVNMGRDARYDPSDGTYCIGCAGFNINYKMIALSCKTI